MLRLTTDNGQRSGVVTRSFVVSWSCSLQSDSETLKILLHYYITKGARKVTELLNYGTTEASPIQRSPGGSHLYSCSLVVCEALAESRLTYILMSSWISAEKFVPLQ